MLDLENFPPQVLRLAAACMVDAITAQQIMHTSSENAAQFASRAGLSFEQFLDAINWLAEYLETHSPRGLPSN
jgi:hypothetical protein